MNNNPLLRKKSEYVSINQLIFLIAGQLFMLVEEDKWSYIYECMQNIRQKLHKYNISNIDDWEYFYVRDGSLYDIVKNLILDNYQKLNVDPDCIAQNVCYYFYLEESSNKKYNNWDCSMCKHDEDDTFTNCQCCARNPYIKDYFEFSEIYNSDTNNDNSIYCKYGCLKIGNFQCCKSCDKLDDCNLVCLNIDNIDSCEYARKHN